MEEKPPTQAGRDVPRSRTPRSTFGTPDQPTPPSKPAERAPRRSKAAPAVTFQAPAPDENTSPEATPGRKPTQRSQSGRAPAKKAPAAKAAPPAKDAAKAAAPAKAAAAKATPSAKAAAETAAPAEQAAKAAAPAKKAAAATAKAAPAKRAPKKIPAQSEAIDTAPPPRDKPARAKKATAKTTAGNAGKSDQLDAVPAQPAADATPPAKAMPTQVAVSSTGGAAQPQPTIFSKVAADPGHAPELLALAAVQSIGPRAKEWAKRTREAYPKATDAAVARLAADQFTRFTSPTSIVTALTGSYAPSTLIATTALTHARVILHVAAAYGIDPTDEARAADLLVLTRIQPSREDAEAALAAARRKQAATDTVKRIARMVATNAAGWVAVKLVSRYFPGTSLLAAALVSRSSARNMAERATTYYSQASHALGSTV
jgi:hypothetical protein